MMATSMWRMNGLHRRIGGVLLLWILLLSTEVTCQDDSTTASPPADPGTSVAPDVDSSVAVTDGGQSGASSAAPGDTSAPGQNGDIITKDQDDGTSQATAAPDAVHTEVSTVAEIPPEPHTVKLIVPVVKCVAKEEIPESGAVKAEVSTNDCEQTKLIIKENPAAWCNMETCDIELFQDEKTLFVTSKNAKLHTLADALQSEHLKEKLGVTKTETPSSSGPSVFVGILVTGLLAAIGIIVAYFKCKRCPDAKGAKLAEEGYPVDQENQGNTLVSDAPLNPPPETQEKPNVNGESPEAAKTQTPPTNGHSTAKTADTEL